jgi:hypothetical protein
MVATVTKEVGVFVHFSCALFIRKETLLAISLLFIIEANDLLIDYYSTIENKKK